MWIKLKSHLAALLCFLFFGFFIFFLDLLEGGGKEKWKINWPFFFIFLIFIYKKCQKQCTGKMICFNRIFLVLKIKYY
jgi:EamA domain-containing membrane protein RarD